MNMFLITKIPLRFKRETHRINSYGNHCGVILCNRYCFVVWMLFSVSSICITSFCDHMFPYHQENYLIFITVVREPKSPFLSLEYEILVAKHEKRKKNIYIYIYILYSVRCSPAKPRQCSTCSEGANYSNYSNTECMGV